MSTGSNLSPADAALRVDTGFVADKRSMRKKTAVVGLLLVVAVLVSLCADPSFYRLNGIDEVFSCYGLWFQQLYVGIASPADCLSTNDILGMHSGYYRIMSQAGATFIVVVCGGLLALAGSLYQSVFRNPIASPTMLGIASGTRLGILLFVLVYGVDAVNLFGIQYLFCYGAAVVTLVLLFVMARVMDGKGKPLNVINLLLAGTILNQLIAALINYLVWFQMDTDLYETYSYLVEALNINTGIYAYAALLLAVVIGVIPIFLLRFRLNALSYGHVEMQMLGIRPQRLQIVSLICGTVIIMAAMVQVGAVAMVSLVVPHVSRALFGAEFRKQFVGNVLIGALLLLVCKCVVAFIPFVGDGLPVGTVVDFVVLPAFVWILATQQRKWE